MTDLKDIAARIWRDVQLARQQEQLQRIKASPEKYRLTRIMEKGLAYTYWPAGERVMKTKKEVCRMCVSRQRNAAGNFLLWREVRTFTKKKDGWHWKQTQRFDMAYSPIKADARDTARRRAAHWPEKHPEWSA